MGVGMNVAFNYVQCFGSTLKVDSSTERTCFVFEISSERILCDDSCESRAVSKKSSCWRAVDSADVSAMHILQPLEPVKPSRGLGLKESSGRHVLVVDDNTICQKVCKRLLEKMGHTCEVASNGAIAVNMVADSSFDIVLMDLRMPVMDGIDSALSIRSSLHSEVPIIAFSAESDESIRDATKDAGMNDFIEKPATSSVLEEVINKYC
jgi:CheY-like chemotaxis protein